MFGNYVLSLGRVYDNVIVRENGQKLVLHVNADPNRLVIGLTHAQKQLAAITADTTPEDREKIALYFAGVIFGEEQAKKLLEYYRGDTSCVIGICGKYFADRLGKMITKSQKKQKNRLKA